MKVTREVDTVIVEMDIDLAEKLMTILYRTHDDTRHFGDLTGLAMAMAEFGDVRAPSPLYVAETTSGGMLRVRNTTSAEMAAMR